MLALILLAQVATATPAPPPPTPVPGQTRSLSDVARERRGKPKPAGSLVVAGQHGTPAEVAGEHVAPEDDPRNTIKPRVEVTRVGGGLGVSGTTFWINGAVENTGRAAACWVKVNVTLWDSDGKKVIGTNSTFTKPDRIEAGQTATFLTYVDGLGGRASASVAGFERCK